jgi:hypothetical protein
MVAALAVMMCVAPQVARASTVTGWWRMDESSGTVAADSSGHHDDGKLENIQLDSGAYAFNGTNSRVLVPDDAILNPGAADITISVDVKFSSIHVHDYDLVRKGQSGDFYKIEIASSGRARCQFHGSAHDDGLVFGPSLADGTWHTIVCTKTGSKISGKVDGHSATRSVSVGAITNHDPLSFGGKASGTQDLYRGLMRDVLISIG